MKKAALISAALFCVAGSIYGQDELQKASAKAAAAFAEAPKTKEEVSKPSFWTNSVLVGIGFNQTGLFSWAAGGYNSLTLNAGLDAKAVYSKDLISWNNRLQLKYGFLWSADKDNLLQKSNDLIKFESSYGYKTAKDSKWRYTASFDFRSQFTDSYDSYKKDGDSGDWTGTLKSGFMSPAYTTFALGMEWAPVDWFNVNIAPATGGITFCSTEALRAKYGMDLKDEGLDPAVGSNYRGSLFQFGAQVKINFKTSINKVFKYETQLVLFTNYLNKPFTHNRVNWDNSISWQMAKYFAVGLDTWLIYDPIVLIGDRQRVQFKEFFSVNFTYTFGNKK